MCSAAAQHLPRSPTTRKGNPRSATPCYVTDHAQGQSRSAAPACVTDHARQSALRTTFLRQRISAHGRVSCASPAALFLRSASYLSMRKYER
jgi:hypothetical protein